VALGIPVIFYGIIYHTTMWGKAMIVLGILITLSSLIGWSTEPLEEPHSEHADSDEGDAPEPAEEVIPS
jgi:hypothetical protein